MSSESSGAADASTRSAAPCVCDSRQRPSFDAVSFNAARNPLANVTASSFAQKCMKKSRGSSLSMCE